MERMGNGQVYTGYAGNYLSEQRPLGRHRRGLECNIKMDIQEEGWAWTGMIWIKTGTVRGLL